MSEYVLYSMIALTLSVSVNAFLIWFARKSSGRLTVVASNIDEILLALENFESHLETLYEMETFYGDETLQSVLNHSKGLTEFLSGFEDIYELSEELLDETEEEQEEVDVGQESNKFTSQAQEEEEKTPKKVVFHSGT